ncbi:MAG: hypothetical protein V3V12_00880 [Gammaproteobacteria bacterium]
MEWIIIIAIIAIIWFAVSVSKKPTETEIPIKISIESSSRGGGYDPDRVVDTGKVNQVSEGAFCINHKSPLPLTLEGLSISDAKQIKKLLDGEAQWQRNLCDLTFLIAQHNIECVELEKFIGKLRLEVNEYITQRKLKSDEWAASSEKDKADLTREFQNAALEHISAKPNNERALETLLYGSPGDVTVDDQLLELFSGNRDIYRFYVTSLGRGSKVNQIPADDYYRKNWESLVELGLANRGKNIPVEAILDGLRMKDINEYFSDRLEKKLTRKAKAVEYAATQSDVLDVLSKHISFRELFQISEPKDIEVSAIKACYEYAAAQAEVIRDTYVTGYRTLDALEDARDAEYDGWEIEAEDCCQQCLKLNGKKSKRKPSKLPPFHVGCTCSLEGVYD